MAGDVQQSWDSDGVVCKLCINPLLAHEIPSFCEYCSFEMCSNCMKRLIASTDDKKEVLCPGCRNPFSTKSIDLHRTKSAVIGDLRKHPSTPRDAQAIGVLAKLRMAQLQEIKIMLENFERIREENRRREEEELREADEDSLPPMNFTPRLQPKERKVRAKTFHGGDSRRIPNILDVLPKTRGELRRRNGPQKLRRARRSAVHSKASAGLSITIQQDASMEDVSTPKQTFPFDVPSYSGDSSDPILPDPSGLGMAESPGLLGLSKHRESFQNSLTRIQELQEQMDQVQYSSPKKSLFSHDSLAFLDIDMVQDDFDVDFDDEDDCPDSETLNLIRSHSLDSGIVAFNEIEFDTTYFEDINTPDIDADTENLLRQNTDYIMFLRE